MSFVYMCKNDFQQIDENYEGNYFIYRPYSWIDFRALTNARPNKISTNLINKGFIDAVKL